MKQIFKVLFACLLLFASCKKESTVERLTVEQLNQKYHIDLIKAWETSTVIIGMRSIPNPNRGAKPQKDDIVTVTEGTFTWDGANFTTCDNVKFAGVNNQTTIVSVCNWFFYEGTPPQNLMCTDTNQQGQIMAWDCDYGNNVRRSNLVTQ